MALNFEIPKLVRELKKRKPKKVLVQLAEGIKQNASEISRVFEKTIVASLLHTLILIRPLFIDNSSKNEEKCCSAVA